MGTSANACGSVPFGAKSYTYGDATNPGLPTTITDENGHNTTLSYTSYGDLLTATDADGNQASFTYDSRGRKHTMSGPLQ